jgi:hypothetical protein
VHVVVHRVGAEAVSLPVSVRKRFCIRIFSYLYSYRIRIVSYSYPFFRIFFVSVFLTFCLIFGFNCSLYRV